jgi:arylsulfatase A-like enzyme
MTDRREFVQQVSAYLASAGVLGSGPAVSRAGDVPEKRPNILFIAVDDLNDWVGCLGGHPDTLTPNIDRLAGRGVLFKHAYCSAPACNPSRASLLTGIRPSTSGVYHNNQPWRPVLPDAVTLPRHFKDNGYHVEGRGKIYHGGHSQDEESWHHYTRRGSDPNPAQYPLNMKHKTKNFDWGPLDVADEEMDDRKVVDWAESFLSKPHDKSFFLACGLFRPHLPWYVPRKYFKDFPAESITLPNVKEDDLDDIPPMGREMARRKSDHEKVLGSGNWRKAVSSYLASIHFTDANVGRLMEALNRSSYAENTIVVLWGDHGWHLGEKLHWRKFALWEEATHCPLIVVGPGVAKGEKCVRTVSLLDIYPTLADVCGLPNLNAWEGETLGPLLKDPHKSWERPALTTHGRENHSVRSERWRYIRYADGTEELYDHNKDSLEWTNLANRAEYAETKKQLAEWLPKVNVENAPKAN